MMLIFRKLKQQIQTLLRILLSHYVANGVSAAFGLFLISGTIQFFAGSFAAAAASVGVLVCIPPDQPAPKRGKFWRILPAALIGPPLFYVVQILHSSSLHLGLLLVPATFIAFLAGAWGKRGLPISISIMFAMIFSMAVPPTQGTDTALTTTLYFTLGAGLYLIYATLANALLNQRYRVQILAETLLSLANLLRAQALQFAPHTKESSADLMSLNSSILRQQTDLADQLQMARDIVLESPRTARRQQLAGMLMRILEIRDHLLVVELDLEMLKKRDGHAPLFDELRRLLSDMAEEIQRLADALLLGRTPPFVTDRRPQLAALRWVQSEAMDTSPAVIARGLTNRIALMNDEVLRLTGLARGDLAPDLAVVRAAWQMFVSPTGWSWRPFFSLWHWQASPLRHAIRAALAIGLAYAISLVLPWGTHAYWILLTIVVVLRGSLAQTLERRNSRVMGTLIGCILASAILFFHPSPITILITVVIAQAFAHGFAAKRYVITAISATVLGLVQASVLSMDANPVFGGLERIADTIIGAAIAWPFSYLLPTWERTQIPTLVKRVLTAQAQHAQVALSLGQLEAVDNEPELKWRLARREVYDSLSALAQATQRSLVEPRAIRPPLPALELLLTQSYHLLAQLTAIKTMLLLQRGRLNPEQVREPLIATAEIINTTLLADQSAPATTALAAADAFLRNSLPDPFEQDLSPWLLRRLGLATNIATQVRSHGDDILRALAGAKLPVQEWSADDATRN